MTPYFNDVHDRTPYHFKRHAIQNCLYGVDIDAGAVEIARLRLWLSLVVDEEETKQIKPLPNLFYKIIAGNSLIEVEKTLFNEKLFQELERLKPLYFDESITSKKASLRHQIDSIIHQLTNGKETFDFHIYFSEVFHYKGGFDVVIANPPYGLLNKRQNKHESVVLSEQELQYFKSSAEYAPARGGMINIFRLFVVRSVNILRTGGCCTEIFPLAFAGDASASELRKHLLNKHQLVGIEAFPERDNEKKRVFEAVKMSVCIMILKASGKANSPFWLRVQKDRFVDPGREKTSLSIKTIETIDRTNYTIPLLMSDELTLLESVYGAGRPLGTVAHCYTGEIDLTHDKPYLSKDKRHATLIKGAIIDKYRIRDSMSQGEILFLKSREYLENNHGKRSHHYKSSRIVMQGITGVNEKTRLKMTIVEKGTFCANSVNYVVFNDCSTRPEYFLALLNSTLLNFVFSKTSTNSNVNGYEIDNLPIKIADELGQTRLIALVEKILLAKKRSGTAVTATFEREIDAYVYELYGLTDEQRMFVEERSAPRPGESILTVVGSA